MTARVSINTDNAAFEDNPAPEIARILRNLADKVENMGVEKGEEISLRDINGNPVGKFTLR